MKAFEIRFTDAAQQSVEDLAHYLADYLGLDIALKHLDSLIDMVEKAFSYTLGLSRLSAAGQRTGRAAVPRT
jgi:plasmid stabilization system protein ParE